MKKERICKECKWYRSAFAKTPDGVPLGHCHKYPPGFRSYAGRYLFVLEDDWCAQWRTQKAMHVFPNPAKTENREVGMKVVLHNGQGTPYLCVSSKDNNERMRIYFCKDGGVIHLEKKTIGTRLGCRTKSCQVAYFEDAPLSDELELGEIKMNLGKDNILRRRKTHERT